MGLKSVFRTQHQFLWVFNFTRSCQASPPPFKHMHAHTRTCARPCTHTFFLRFYFQCYLKFLSMTTWEPTVSHISPGHCLWLQLLHRKLSCHVIPHLIKHSFLSCKNNCNDGGHYNILSNVSKTEFFRTPFD